MRGSTWVCIVSLLAVGAAWGQADAPAASTPAVAADRPERANRLIVTDLRKGSGPALQVGQSAVVQYTGWIYVPDSSDHKGTKFDSSRDHQAPFTFFVGGGDVILGWDQGVVGMQVGGERRLIVPPAFGYGAKGAGNDIPPNATLLFEIELVGIK